MTYDEDVTPRERKFARNLAIGMHLAVILLLIFGVSWHRRQSEQPAVADLWGTMSPPPPPRQQEVPRVETPPPLKMTPKIEKEPTPAPPPPKPEVKRDPKPDIALKEKLEKERKLKEEERRREEEKKQKLAEERRRDEEKKLKVVEARKKDEERRKLEQQAQQELDAKRAAEKEAAARQASAAAAQSRAMDAWTRLIQDKVRRNIVEPPNLQGNPQVEFDVVQIPGGEVLSVRMTRSSGVPAYDAAVERAILKASPLPPPPDSSMFVRELHLKIRPKE